MTDTQRPITTLLDVLFRDGQDEGEITPQDIRDLIVSIAQTPFGGVHALSTAETAIDTVSVYKKVAGTFALTTARNMDVPVDNRLRYIGLIPFHFRIACSLSLTAVQNNKLFTFGIFIFDDSASSGAIAIPSEVTRKMGTGTDEGSLSLHWDVILETNDYIEIHVKNISDDSNLTVQHLYFSAEGTPA